MSVQDLKNEYRMIDDGDAWGACMAWLFAIADYITYDTEASVPYEWMFNSPCGSPDDDAYEYQLLKECNIEPDTILAFGAILWRYRGMLKAAGEDY